MTTLELGSKLVELCKQGKNEVALDTLYATDVVSVEAGGPPGQDPETRGLAGVVGKAKWWAENHEVHSASADGPYPNGDQFIVKFVYDITQKQTGARIKMEEMALYTVKDDKIVREVFFYAMG